MIITTANVTILSWKDPSAKNTGPKPKKVTPANKIINIT